MSRSTITGVSASTNPARMHWASFPQRIDRSTIVTVTADAASHTKGAWTELIAATTAPATWLIIEPSGTATTGADSRALFDIGFGAAASEVVKIANLPGGFLNSVAAEVQSSVATYAIPIDVPAGTRISARLQAFVSADTLSVSLATAATKPAGGTAPAFVDTYGADTANSRGTNMPTSDTYVEITAATTQPYGALVLLAAGGTGVNYAAATVTYTLAVGASGSEVAIGTGRVTTGSTEFIASAGFPRIFAGHYPKGTRIACKQTTGANYRDVIVVGIPYS